MKRIETLLDAYYRGETSPQETGELLSLFSAVKDLSPSLQTERSVFMAIEGRRGALSAPPPQLEQRIEAMLDRMDKTGRRKTFGRRFAVSAAASIALILSAAWLAISYTEKTMPEADSSAHSELLSAAIPDIRPAVTLPDEDEIREQAIPAVAEVLPATRIKKHRAARKASAAPRVLEGEEADSVLQLMIGRIDSDILAMEQSCLIPLKMEEDFDRVVANSILE